MEKENKGKERGGENIEKRKRRIRRRAEKSKEDREGRRNFKKATIKGKLKRKGEEKKDKNRGWLSDVDGTNVKEM